MDLTYITVTGTFLMPDAITPKTGYVEFRPNVGLTQSGTGEQPEQPELTIVYSGHAVLVPKPLRAMLDLNGSFEIQLLATDNELLFPKGWLWHVDEKVEFGNNWYLQLLTPPAPGAYDPLDITQVYYPPGAFAGPPTVVLPGPAPLKGEKGDKGDKGNPGTPGNVRGSIWKASAIDPAYTVDVIVTDQHLNTATGDTWMYQ